LQARSETLSDLEKLARAVDPHAAPQATIESALASMHSAREAGADAKIGGQIRERVAVLRETEHQLNDRLSTAFGSKLSGWSAALDPASMILRFQRPDLLFEQGSATLRPGFKTILNEFFPEYIRILYEFKNDIEEVRIEGHTSSEWSGLTSDMQAYFLNMRLSQDRTRAVLEYGLTETALPPAQVLWARKLITANGLSSSRPRESGGIEDKDASRRVEFRVLTHTKEQLLKIVDPGSR
jgi:outer membrane protein OmpA-like peptidoglycan-associated protein